MGTSLGRPRDVILRGRLMLATIPTFLPIGKKMAHTESF